MKCPKIVGRPPPSPARGSLIDNTSRIVYFHFWSDPDPIVPIEVGSGSYLDWTQQATPNQRTSITHELFIYIIVLGHPYKRGHWIRIQVFWLDPDPIVPYVVSSDL